MQSFKNKYYVTDDDIYLINKCSILVLGSFLMANIVVFVIMCLTYIEMNSRRTVPIQWSLLQPGF